MPRNDETFVDRFLEPRNRHQAAIAFVAVAGRIGALLRNDAQAAVRAEHPTMIEALEHARLAGLLPAHAPAPVRAEIVEHVNLAGGVAAEDEVAAGDSAGQK